MRDQTSEPDGLEPDDSPLVEADDVTADELSEPDGEAGTDSVEAGARPVRRTSKAPVRRKPSTPEADDAVIEELEESLGATPSSGTSTLTRRTSKAPVRKTVKERPVKDLAEAEEQYGAVGPATFVKQSAGELRKVVWPTWPELVSYFTAVLIFVLFFIAFVGLLDLFFGWGLLEIFGERPQ